MSVLDGWYLFDNDMNAVLAALEGKEFIVTGLAVTEKGVPDMSVDVAAGTYYANGTKAVKGAPTNLAIGASDPVDFRKDIVVGDAAGTLSVVAGVANSKSPAGGSGPTAFRPVPPDIPANKVLIAEVWIEAGETTILDADITDRRTIVAPDTVEHATDEPFVGHLNNPAARAYHSGAQAIPNGALTLIAFDSERFDTDTIHDLVVSNSRLTCKTAGIYQITASFVFATNAVGERRLYLRLNNTHNIGMQFIAATALATYMAVTTLIELSVNDYVDVSAYQTSGGALNVEASAQYSPEFMMVRVG